MQNPPAMQNLVDSFCQCFGTAPHQGGMEAFQHPMSSATSEMKRRTRSLSLKDKAWDPLFEERQPRHGVTLEQAQAVAKAKLQAATAQKRAVSTKRKRTRSKDDIFRSKKAAPKKEGNAFSRFLSNHPVIAHSLCFATPIRESNDDVDNVSVVSDSNTLNTAEDTITSTLYYERTKLAGLEQKSPPMPLFNSQSVDRDIHKIVRDRTRSSFQELPPGVANISTDSSATPNL